MKEIKFFNKKLLVEVPDYYEYSLEDYGSLVLFHPENRTFTIKFIVIDSNGGKKEKEIYDNKNKNNFKIKLSENKYYNINNYEFKIEEKILFVTSFEIIFKNYYINIRINTLEKIQEKSYDNLLEYINEIILTIKENIEE